MRNLRRWAMPVLTIMLLCSALSVTAFATGEEVAEVSRFYQTIWSLLPPVVAIVLSALFLKEKIGVFGILGAIIILFSALINELPQKKK